MPAKMSARHAVASRANELVDADALVRAANDDPVGPERLKKSGLDGDG